VTQPPDEPQPPGGEDSWQPPGPPQLQPPPPRQQNPYGGGTTNYYQPIDSGAMSSGVKIFLGVVIGIFGGFFLWIVAAFAFAASGTGSDEGFLLFAAVAPLVVPAPLLMWPATRPWAVGLLIGTAVSSIGLSRLCSTMLDSV
jgi:hypothetical protein